ncbi:MAG TPA: Crp/Fnr family transcriptional regulator [Moheibacter sp.]|nr:Crp/Fnr family transcriptional regulator [Moheibacter sp.]
MTVLDFLRTLYVVDDELEHIFNSLNTTKEFEKGDIIFKPGQYLRHIYFIESGFTRVYYHKGNKEITHCFFGQDTFCTGVESVYYQKACLFGFQALSAARITMIPFEPIRKFANSNITINRIIEKILLDNLIEFSKRFYNSQFETASERYAQLLLDNPELLQNASLGHIASYLGVSQQTLSVIRGMK